ncbi:MAG: long-chain fatty acid--CoA ligase [Myxococcales bacterium]|jgi:long-chain acyl-CoA synthetase
MSYQPRYSNLVTVFDEATTKYADRPLFGTRKPSGWEWTSYKQFRQLVDRARGGLACLGVGAGDRVAVIANNRLEWAICAYATYTHGATYVPMYEAQLDKDWDYILRDSGAKVCLVSGGDIPTRVNALKVDLPDLEHVIDFDGAPYADMMRKGAENPVDPGQPADQDVAALIYTSGTTGNPKGVELTHFNLAANVCGLLDISPVQEGDRSLAFLPWAHVFGGAIELNTVMAVGGTIAICDNTDRLLEYLPEVKPTMLFAVPRIWNRIYDGVQKQVKSRPEVIQKIFAAGMSAKSKLKQGQPLSLGERVSLPLAEKLIFSKIVERFGGQLRFAFSGAAALSSEVGEFIDNLGIQVYEGYGMTESSGCTTANVPGATRIGSVGKPIPGVDVKLDESAAGAGEGEGEIIIYGTGVMRGYHNLQDATRESMTEDGGLRSGDLGRIDADGFLYITGRVKELYKLENGKYVAPAPLEEKIQLSPFIAQCVIYGDDKPHNVALIMPDMPSLQAWAQGHGVPTERDALLADPRTKELLRKEIDSHSREFKGFERVRDFILSGEELSTENGMLTPTLKVKRRNVMARYEEQLAALYG